MSLFTRPDLRGDEASEPSDDEETVRIARKRFARRQRARRWLAWRRVVVAVLLVALVVAGVWLVFFSTALAVNGVRVTGTESLDPRVVRRAAQVPLGGPLATVDLAGIAERVRGVPAVKSVDVSRSWPDRVRIDVVEREAVAVVQQRGVLRGLDEDGVLFRRYPSRPTSLPVVHTGSRTRKDALAEAARVGASLPPALAARVDYVEVQTVDKISLQLRNGKTVLWGSADDSVDKARVLEALLRHKASYYDVTVPGDPVIRR
jgi:cell division protein FtsQ